MSKLNNFEEQKLKALINQTLDNYLDFEILNILGVLTKKHNVEISLILNSKNRIISYSIGNFQTVKFELNKINETKINQYKIIHTHPNNTPFLSNMDLATTTKLQLAAIIALAVDNTGKINRYAIGIGTINNEQYQLYIEENKEINMFNQSLVENLINIHKVKQIKPFKQSQNNNLIINFKNDDNKEEIIELAKACNLTKNIIFSINLKKISNSTLITSGKIDEIGQIIKINQIQTVIIDCELSSIQHKNLSDSWQVDVFDRKALIIEIFKQRAKSKEAKLQVLIAELKQKQTRLKGYGTSLSRIGGGLKSKGSGEQKLELDRRLIQATIHNYEKELQKIETAKQVTSKRKINSDLPTFSLVGYTNVGKSTILNLLLKHSSKNRSQKSEVFAADMLFATLSTTTKKIILPKKNEFLITDTVGFIQNLPHDLVASFKSTLKEAMENEYILHIIDISDKNYMQKKKVVEEILTELSVSKTQIIEVYNKIDQNISNEINDEMIKISAKNDDINELLRIIEKLISKNHQFYEFTIDYAQIKNVSKIYQMAIVEEIKYDENTIHFKILTAPKTYQKIKNILKIIE